MAVTLLNNYPESNLKDIIIKKNGSPLFGEIWLYQQFLNFNKFNFLPGEKWYFKHDYNLSAHPASEGKVEGQIDFILLSKYGLLIIEVKGGGLYVDSNDRYFSKSSQGEYETQNPFNQAKEYTHTLKELIDQGVFVYRAVVLPGEAGFKLKGPQLEGYKNLLFSKKNFKHLKKGEDDEAISRLFFDFLIDLGKSSRSKILQELHPGWDLEKVNNKRFEKYPKLSTKKLKSIKSELFPSQSSYGYNPDRINSEIILNENYETLKGLRRNRKVIVQGAPGTGKTVLARKYLAQNILKQQRGIFYCANKLIKSKLEHSILRDYGVNEELIEFRIYHKNSINESLPKDVEFVIFDEAQEYFNKGLFELIEKYETELEFPKLLVLYDPKQTIIYNFNDITFYTDFYIENRFTHYFFDENYRCGQHSSIKNLSNQILNNKSIKPDSEIPELVDKLSFIKEIVDETRFLKSEQIILVHSDVFESFEEIAKTYFKDDLEQLSDGNINNASTMIRYTTPIKFRGLETKSVYLLTDGLKEKSKTQNYVGVTRAMESVKIAIWT